MATSKPNSVALAGEFAVLCQLALRDYDANMTLGNTKGVDILVSDQNKDRLLKLEVKTSRCPTDKPVSIPKEFGDCLHSWVMKEKHESLADPSLFYCFVLISHDNKRFRFFILPSQIVADYVKAQHQLWLDGSSTRSRTNALRQFRIGYRDREYAISTPAIEDYEDNWEFQSKL